MTLRKAGLFSITGIQKCLEPDYILHFSLGFHFTHGLQSAFWPNSETVYVFHHCILLLNVNFDLLKFLISPSGGIFLIEKFTWKRFARLWKKQFTFFWKVDWMKPLLTQKITAKIEWSQLVLVLCSCCRHHGQSKSIGLMHDYVTCSKFTTKPCAFVRNFLKPLEPSCYFHMGILFVLVALGISLW